MTFKARPQAVRFSGAGRWVVTSRNTAGVLMELPAGGADSHCDGHIIRSRLLRGKEGAIHNCRGTIIINRNSPREQRHNRVTLTRMD